MMPFIEQAESKNKVSFSIVILTDMTRKLVRVLSWCATQFHSDSSGHLLVLRLSRDKIFMFFREKQQIKWDLITENTCRVVSLV